VVTSEDCKAYKPRSEPFKKALSILNLANEEVLHVGDSIRSDIQGAKAMRIPVLWINRKKRSFPAKLQHPDYTSIDLKGILEILQK
jgi:FMN phosphatase YigB (HAD superfamily)